MSKKPDSEATRETAADSLQLIVSLAVKGDLESAVAKAQALADIHVTSNAWRAPGELNANLQRRDQALSRIRIALRYGC